jgi:hypothetical protein
MLGESNDSRAGSHAGSEDSLNAGCAHAALVSGR